MKVGKLKQDGELLVKGVDTRSPLVTDGLVAHYPMDGTTKGIANNNILDYSTWNIGTSGNQTGFPQNGDGNSIVEDVGPFGDSQAVWQSLGNDATSDADGGWNSNSFAIDRTKKYRHSVWIRRKVTGNGSGYFGCLGSSVYNIAANTVNTNPYFWSGSFSNNDWLLFVSYVYPSDIGNVVPTDDAGIYNTAKTKLSSIGTFKFSPTATTNYHRTYLFYSTLAATNQQWAYPRVDLCDGTEPSLDDLLSGEGNVINISSGDNYTLTNDSVAIEENTTNLYIDGNFALKTLHPVRSGNWTFPSDKFGSNNENVIRLDPNGSRSYHGRDITVVVGYTYTFSCMMFVSHDANTSYMAMYGEKGFSLTARYDLSKKGTWQYISVTGAATSTNARILLYQLTPTMSTGYVLATNIQFEQKAFPTSYVDGSRSASGKFTVLNPVKTGEFTVSYDWKSNSPVGTSSSYQTSFSMGTYYTNNSFTIMDTNIASTGGAQRLIRKGNAGEWAWIDANLTETASFQDWTTITIVRNATYYRAYSNGIYKGQLAHSSTTMQDYIHVGSRESWRAGENSSIRNLSIYNRALSDSEILNLSKGTHKFTLDSLITNGINTRPNIPSDAFYYPLDLNAKDEYNLYLPSEDIGNYTDGLYVGSGNSVEYNFNSSLGLDWNGDWSICYFKKPIGTHLGETNLTGYNIESFGCNSNTVGGGYLWFGKLISSNSIQGASNGAITPDSYFNNWQCITIIKSGTSVTISTWITDKISRDRTVVLGTISSNRFVTQYGYDFKLSGWDNTNPCHSYFRDLIVVKRAMTSDELKNYRNVKMKATSDVLYIQNGINSTATL